MPKFPVKRLFKLEYILIFFSFITCLTTEIFKHNTLESFTKIDNDIRDLQILYNDPSKSSAYKDELYSKIMDECLPYIYFSTESKHKLIRILELFKYDAVSWNTNHQNAKYFTNLVVAFHADIKNTQTAILFGFDSMLFCSVFLLFLATIVLISKLSETKTLPSQEPYQDYSKKSLSSKQIVAYALFTAFAIGFNYLTSFIPRNVSVPLYLDSTMTMAVSALCGISFGIICAIISNVILFLSNSVLIPFVLCHILTAVLAGLTFRHRRNRTLNARLTFDVFLWAGVWSAISNGLLGDIMANHMFDTSTASPILDGSVLGLYVVFNNLTVATYLSGLFTNISDKLFSASISFIIYALISKKNKNIFR